MNMERTYELGDLRRTVLREATKQLTEHLTDALTALDTKALDDACLALADKLREPEKCPHCGQEVPCPTA